MANQHYQRKKANVITATGLASLISTFLTNPLEVAKLNYQYMPLACPYYPHPSMFLTMKATGSLSLALVLALVFKVLFRV